MLTDPTERASAQEQLLADLQQLRRFPGSPAEFWSAFIKRTCALVGANRGVLVVRDPNQPERLKKLGEWITQSGHAERSVQSFTQALSAIAHRCLDEGALIQRVDTGVGDGNFAMAVPLPLENASEKCAALFLLLSSPESAARESLVRLHLAADIPSSYQTSQGVQVARAEVAKMAAVLDLMVQVNAEKRFLAAALAFCNGLATRYGCERVSLGWLEGGYVRLRAISRTERFDRHMAAVRSIEATMEEAFDQDEEIVWPAPPGSSFVTQAHETFVRQYLPGHLCTSPLRLDNKPVAAILCERQSQAFSASEVQQLRLACDQAARRLADLKREDRWFGARWWEALRQAAAKVVGPEHTWPKVIAGLGVVLVVVALLPIFPFRVEGNFITRSDDVAYLTAPFQGYIEEVPVRPGDPVPAGASLLRFDTSDLELNEAEAMAEQVRYLREAEKAQAAGQLAEMRIDQALADQAKARLDLVRYHLSQATIRSPFDGVVVEGDLRQRIGAPVEQGEALFKVARTDSLYLEAEVNERDVHWLTDDSGGEIAFVTQPKLKFPVRVARIEPAAFPKEGENLFVVRCSFVNPPEDWWRPGMSGVCKLDVDRRILLWIAIHRTIDFLRMFFWW